MGFTMDGFCPNLDCNVVINPPANVPAPVSDTGIDGTSGSAIASFDSHSHGLNDYGLSPEWERRMIGGGAFVSDGKALNILFGLISGFMDKCRKLRSRKL